MRSPIVCGVDGSPASVAAARLAHAIADWCSLPLDVLHVTYQRGEAEQMACGRAVQCLLRVELGVELAIRVETGAVTDRLLRASRTAVLVVIGSRGAGPLRRWLAGSVTSVVTRAAASPVIVVPRRVAGGDAAELAGGRLICAVRDEGDLAACGTAACWARELGVALTLAHVVSPRQLPVTPLGGPRPPACSTAIASRYGRRERCWPTWCASSRRARRRAAPAVWWSALSAPSSRG